MTRSIRLGQQVHATDGPCGEVADIIIDPVKAAVTHVVIEPHGQHRQARLVPISTLSDGASSHLSLALTTAQLRGLPAVCSDDFVHAGGHVHVGGDWDVGIEQVSALPYWDAKSAFAPPIWTKTRQDTWDRIPKGECEIRRQSEVATTDGKLVGHVEGFVADGDHLVAIIIRPSSFTVRSNVLAPMNAVERIRTDRIELNLDRQKFKTLETVNRTNQSVSSTLLDRTRDLAGEVKRRLQHRRPGAR